MRMMRPGISTVSYTHLVYVVLLLLGAEDSFLGGLCSGISTGVLIVGALMTSRCATRIQAWKWNVLHRRDDSRR